MRGTRKVAALAAMAMIVVAPLPAQAAGCWAAQDVSAAKVRDLQTMLMVAALRCQASGNDVIADYNAFVSASRGPIAAMNQRLKAHFWIEGSAEGQMQYDRFTTALANAHGRDETGGDTCAEVAAIAQEAAAAPTIDGLIAIAEARMVNPALPGGACGVTLASNQP